MGSTIAPGMVNAMFVQAVQYTSISVQYQRRKNIPDSRVHGANMGRHQRQYITWTNGNLLSIGRLRPIVNGIRAKI